MRHEPSGHTSSSWADGGRVCWRQPPHFPGFFLVGQRSNLPGHGEMGTARNHVRLLSAKVSAWRFCPEPGERTPLCQGRAYSVLIPAWQQGDMARSCCFDRFVF